MATGRLFLTRHAAKREIKDEAARAEVISAWRKGIFDPLPAKGVPGCRLLKAYVTTPRGPRRTLYLLQDVTGDAIFLMHRPKGDPVGDNMAYVNVAFRKAVGKSIIMATNDIEAGDFEIVVHEDGR
jgi:hypothetical protein